MPATPFTVYESTAWFAAENAIVALPTRSFVTFEVSKAPVEGGPDVEYRSPVIDVGDVHVPPGITSHVGVPLGPYTYHAAKSVDACCVMLRPHPDSDGFHQRAE